MSVRQHGVTGRGMPRRSSLDPGFSLIELVIVVVIVGVIAAIAIPRMSSAAQNSRAATYLASTTLFQKAVDMYAAEHEERSPAHDENGNLDPNADNFVRRLLSATDASGSRAGVFGPYLRDIPRNPGNGRSTVRIGASPGANTAGWVYVPARQLIVPDDSPGWAVVDDFINSGGKTGVSGARTQIGAQATQTIPAAPD